jgi:hypothetical protein
MTKIIFLNMVIACHPLIFTSFSSTRPFAPNPFASSDLAIDLLLRHDTWNNATHMPLTLTYALNKMGESEFRSPFLPQEHFLMWVSDLFSVSCPARTVRGGGSEYSEETRQGTYASFIR